MQEGCEVEGKGYELVKSKNEKKSRCQLLYTKCKLVHSTYVPLQYLLPHKQGILSASIGNL
jgi:hypothetical protein